jgi:hypothetical protein
MNVHAWYDFLWFFPNIVILCFLGQTHKHAVSPQSIRLGMQNHCWRVLLGLWCFHMKHSWWNETFSWGRYTAWGYLCWLSNYSQCKHVQKPIKQPVDTLTWRWYFNYQRKLYQMVGHKYNTYVSCNGMTDLNFHSQSYRQYPVKNPCYIHLFICSTWCYLLNCLNLLLPYYFL